MRELHVVAVSDDGRHVVLAQRRGSSKGVFKVAIDETLKGAIRGELPRAGDEAVPVLSPKDIQARLRAGESAETIAQSAGVPVARVERYAGPVQGEMARMIDGARSAHVVRGRLGRSAVPLGRAVDQALVHGGADEGSGDWSTYRLEDGGWLVTVRWYARKRNRSASWTYDPATREVVASDASSAALAHVESEEALAKRRAPAKEKPAPKPPAKAAPAKKATAKKATAKKATAKKATARKAPAKKAAAAKAPARQAPAKQRKAVAKPVAPAPAKRKAPATPVRALRVVPDPVPTPRRKAAKSQSRASVPAWADVLLGTTPGSER